MKIDDAGVNLIKQFEGFRNHPYLCPAGVPTIGYGNTYYPNGNHITLQDPNITETQGTQMLLTNLVIYEQGVTSMVTKPLSQNQFDALCSFAYNLGLKALRSSTLLRKVNINPNDPTIGQEIYKWVHVNGEVSQGLVNRRAAEVALYFKQ